MEGKEKGEPKSRTSLKIGKIRFIIQKLSHAEFLSFSLGLTDIVWASLSVAVAVMSLFLCAGFLIFCKR